ncbi:Factor of DNA methylation like [Quillaja saponaria]|nr:Factor of DNA methylation like [Quillaja saponaria]
MEKATVEHNKTAENMLKLAEEQRREKVKLHGKIIEGQKILDSKHALELEIESMRGALKVLKHLGVDGDVEILEKMDAIQKEIKDKEEELTGLEGNMLKLAEEQKREKVKLPQKNY